MTSLLGAMLDAPLMGVLKRWPTRLHAVDMEAVLEGWERATFTSVCGRHGLRLMGTVVDDTEIALLWPPRLKGLPVGFDRCRACWHDTGRMRPRTEWKLKGGRPT